MVRKKKETTKKRPVKKKVIKKKPIPKKQTPKEELQETKLTIKQRKFLKYYLESGNVSESALKAGYAFRESGFDTLSKVIIQEAYQRLLDKHGITDKKINEVLLKGLGADSSVSQKYLETALKLKGRLINKTELSGEIKLDITDRLSSARKRVGVGKKNDT